jgi:hypothetical protein
VGEKYDRRTLHVRARFDAPTQLEAALIGELGLRDEQLKRSALDQLERFSSAVGPDALVARFSQTDFEYASALSVRVYNQDALGFTGHVNLRTALA